jgi:2-oxoisovalerate dehydrogenase E1 component alpha subunit
LEKLSLWNEQQEKELVTQVRKDVLSALGRAEKEKKPAWNELFTDVYDELTPNLVEQKQELIQHIQRHNEHYQLDEFAEPSNGRT